ncbi:MAG: glutaminase [Candidatus Aenigmarchaeota archaeon]|nr:glutaminase [Candidatus Aenigmarchaeota archaeon]
MENEIASSQKETKQKIPDAIDHLFDALDIEANGAIKKTDLFQALARHGILEDDARIKETIQSLDKLGDSKISPEAFRKSVGQNITLIEKAMTGQLIIPDFNNFNSFITNIYNRTILNTDGNVSDHIPELSADPEQYAVSICTIDGQRLNIGPYTAALIARSVCTPINYCIALDELGEEETHKHVGRAPKEKGFHYLMLNNDGLPHNPLDASGALMVSSLVKLELEPAKKFNAILDTWAAMAGGIRPGLNKGAILSEKGVSDAEYTLAYFMRQNGLFAKGTDINEILNLYFSCLSIETTTEALSVIASTLANAGICPKTGEKVLKPETVKNCLSLMYSCGMEQYSSEFAFSVGLPAKSGISGVIVIVVPNVMGIAIWSPRINDHGISVRGLDFCRKFIQRFNFHNYDSLIKTPEKINPRLTKNEIRMKGIMALVEAASRGDLFEVQRLASTGIDLNEGDYDNRTPIHLAASEGHINVVEFFISKNVDVNPKDRWGGTPLADARRGGYEKIIALLEKHNARD